MKKHHILTLITAVLIACILPVSFEAKAQHGDKTAGCPAITEARFDRFSASIEAIRQDLKIPGLSAAVICDQDMIWAEGFGFADLENRIPASPDTPYGLAGAYRHAHDRSWRGRRCDFAACMNRVALE